MTRLPLLPWRESHPSCCHVNHRPTGSRLFTLVSLPPRFDYCNCLLTMCSAGFHTSSSCRDREWWWAACVTVKGEASNRHTESASQPVCPSSPNPCSGCRSSNYSFYLFFGLLYCVPRWPRTPLWILTIGFVVKSCSTQLPKLFRILFRDIYFHLELSDALPAF